MLTEQRANPHKHWSNWHKCGINICKGKAQYQ